MLQLADVLHFHPNEVCTQSYLSSPSVYLYCTQYAAAIIFQLDWTHFVNSEEKTSFSTGLIQLSSGPSVLGYINTTGESICVISLLHRDSIFKPFKE